MTDLSDAIDRVLRDGPARAQIRSAYDELARVWDTPQRWKIIRDYYALRFDDIAMGERIDAYELGLDRFLTPIERFVWGDIRELGLPFLMQYPVGRRFVDFGDPVRQIAVEADGAAFHTPESDATKDAELMELGWIVFRIKGRDAVSVRGSNQVREIARCQYGFRCEPLREDGRDDEEYGE